MVYTEKKKKRVTSKIKTKQSPLENQVNLIGFFLLILTR